MRPRLRTQARISRHLYRGERWHVLQDLGSGRFLRLNPAAYRLVVLMDGVRTLDEIWQQICAQEGDQAPSQDEVLKLLTQLNNANVLISDRRPDVVELQKRGGETRRQKLKQYIANPLSLKLPILDPDHFFAALLGRIPASFWPAFMWFWGGLLLVSMAGAAYHWDELTHDIASRSFTADNMLLLVLIFPLLKLIHESGHAIAIKWSGGSCREMGLMFLIFLPVPYVDASQTTGFQNKWRRILVGGAGMMAELLVACIAFWLWSWSDPGLFKSVLHQTLILAGVTTIVFNLNPLMRFDGYYMLADWLEIPNLGQKANQYLGYLLCQHVFKSTRAVQPHVTPREGYWLVAYSIGSFIYRMMVSLAIVVMVGSSFFFVGVLLAMWSLWNMLIHPLLRMLRQLTQHPALEGVRSQAYLMTGSVVMVLLVAILWVPAPSWTSVEGVIWMSEDARVRAKHPCFGEAVLVQPGTEVKAGDRLLSCSDPDLDAQLGQAKARLEELETRFALAASTDRVQMQVVAADMSYARKTLVDLQSRHDALAISADRDGVFQMAAPGDYPGRHLGRGDAVAFVIDPSTISLLTVVPQGDVDLVRKKTRKVELRVAGKVWNKIEASVAREVPAATRELPSLALSLAGGGKIGLDPQADPSGGAAALTPLFHFELALPDAVNKTLPGTRVYVRFVHESEPLSEQWYRNLRQVFLKRFVV